MLDWHRSNSLELPRHKIYLTSLNQLIDRKIVVQPEVQTNNKIFPQRTFAKKLSISHQRAKSSVQIRSRKFDLHWNSKNTKNMVVESSRFGTSHQNKRENHQQTDKTDKLKATYLSEQNKRLDKISNPILKISLAPSPSVSEPFSFSPQHFNDGTQSLELKPDSPQKKFLRKGSNLQKQIVINLLRNKLTRQRQLNQKKQYSNQQIIKMIQVFKGVALSESNKQKKGLLQVDRNLSPLSKKMQSKQLKGWQQEEQLGEQDQHSQK